MNCKKLLSTDAKLSTKKIQGILNNHILKNAGAFNDSYKDRGPVFI